MKWLGKRNQTLALLLLITCVCFKTRAQEAAVEEAQVPPENLIAQVPGLSVLGPQRLTWGVLRAPLLWMQDRLFSFNELDWPTWDPDQVPAVLSPARKNPSWLLTYDEKGQLLEELQLQKALLPQAHTQKMKKKPAHYRFKVVSKDKRVTLTSKAFPWVHPREVFTCESAFNQEKSLKQQPALWTCVQTLKKMVLSADQQWYFKINWPLISDKTIKKEIAAIDRELRIFAIRSRNVYDSAFSKESLFQVQAGVTQSEKFEQVAINYSNWPKSNLLKIPPSREKVQEPALSLEFDDMRLIIQSFAADELVGRQKQSPMAIKPTVDLQFVAADNLTDPQFLETEFREQRTGVQGFLRPWQLATSLEYNSMTSNRGEQDSFFSLPSFDLAYQSDIYKIQAGFHLTTGILHFGSTLSVQEMQVNLRRQIEIIPHLQAVVGYHRYALNGKNPGSSRLGKMDAAVIGMSGFKTSDESFIQGKFLFLVSDAVGFDSQLTYGRYFDNRSDLRFYWGGFLGSAKYASTLINRMLESETFTEERLRVGISFGLIGPDFIEMN